MNRSSRNRSWTLLAAAPAVLFCLARTTVAQEAVGVGSPAPDFTLSTLLAPVERIRLSDYVGDEATEPKRLLLLTFFAPWCHPCQKELPRLAALYARYRARGLMILDVNIDPKSRDLARTMIGKVHPGFPVLSDDFEILSRRYQIRSISAKGVSTVNLPTMFFIDGGGIIRKVKQGYDERESNRLEEEIQAFLNGGTPAR